MLKSTLNNASKLALPAVFVMLALVAAACGGDDDAASAPTDSPLVQAFAANAMADSDPGSPLTTREDAECWASQVVGGIGEDRLGELGVTADSVGDVGDYAFNDDEIGLIVDSLDDCINLRDVLAEQFEEDFGAEAAGCVADEMSGDLLKDAMKSGFTNSDPSADFLQSFLDIAAKCDVPLN